MKRRDLIKTGLLGLSATAVALSGCDKKEVASGSDELKIKPKQTGTYEFSCPLPFNYKTIDEIAEMNEGLKKSKITSFYNNAPSWNHNNWISIGRAKNDFIKTYDDFFKYVKYATSKGFEFTYLMNSPKTFSEKDYNSFKDDFNHLLDLLVEHNVKNIKVANAQVAHFIEEHLPNKINFHASTAFEFNLMSQYEYLTYIIPNISLIDITNGENQNFKLLSALRKKFPKIKLELMVNEGCIKGCPARITCINEGISICINLQLNMGLMNYFLRVGFIYPWNLEYYSALGINNFKFIASTNESNSRSNFHNITSLKAYLNCIEHGTRNVSVSDLFNKIFDKYKTVISNLSDRKNIENMKISEIVNLFPDIRYFIKNGHLCSTRCGVECNYCYECAKKLESLLLYS